MSSKVLISVIASFFLYVLFQVLLLKNFILFDTAFCFLYVAFILLLPLEIGPLTLMTLAFVVGFIIDLFYDSIGINAAACVFIAFLRPYWMKIITPRGGYEEIVIPNLKTMDLAKMQKEDPVSRNESEIDEMWWDNGRFAHHCHGQGPRS